MKDLVVTYHDKNGTKIQLGDMVKFRDDEHPYHVTDAQAFVLQVDQRHNVKEGLENCMEIV